MAEWVDYGSLKGPQGDKGDTGDQGPQGAKGDTGAQGPKGDTGATPVITMTATVDANVGTPSVNVQQGGTAENPTFALSFVNIKGEKGDKGDTGDQGPQGDVGPQGPAGADAQFPTGGTEGQFLKKTATGEEWGDVPAPDMSGYVKYSPEADKLTYDDGTEVSTIRIGDVNSEPYLQMSNNQVGIANRILNQSAGFGIHESSNHPALYLGANQGTTPKSVTGITDSISASPEGLNLATDKAVADYVTAHAGDALPEGGTDGQVLTKTADGEAWEDVPAPDMTGVVKTDSNGKVIAGGLNTAISFESGNNYAMIGSSTGGSLTLHTQSGRAKSRVESSDGNFVEMTAQYDLGATIWTNGSLKIGSKTITSITDSISASPAGNALTTDKAVADYVAANAGGGSIELLWEGNTTDGNLTVNGASECDYLILCGVDSSSSTHDAFNIWCSRVGDVGIAHLDLWIGGGAGIINRGSYDISQRDIYWLKSAFTVNGNGLVARMIEGYVARVATGSTGVPITKIYGVKF